MTKAKNNIPDDDNPAQLSVKAIDERLLAATSNDELDEIQKLLIAEGAPKGTVSSRVTKLKKRGKLVFETNLSTSTNSPNKEAPVDAFIKDMRMQDNVSLDREQVKIFNAGMQFGVNTIIVGVRLAQELSRMGIAQAAPLMRMAGEMRRYEGQSASEAGRAAAEEALIKATEFWDGRYGKVAESKVDIAATPDPYKALMARTLENFFNRTFFKGQNVTPGGNVTLPPGWSSD